VIDDTNFPAANMRFFEIPAAGGLQVTSMTPEMEGMFRQHQEAIYYKNEYDVVTQVQWAMDNPSACSSIRLKAHELVTQQHTYTERLRGILAQI
jgi:spore maturation protein CgeB